MTRRGLRGWRPPLGNINAPVAWGGPRWPCRLMSGGRAMAVRSCGSSGPATSPSAAPCRPAEAGTLLGAIGASLSSMVRRNPCGRAAARVSPGTPLRRPGRLPPARRSGHGLRSCGPSRRPRHDKASAQDRPVPGRAHRNSRSRRPCRGSRGRAESTKSRGVGHRERYCRNLSLRAVVPRRPRQAAIWKPPGEVGIAGRERAVPKAARRGPEALSRHGRSRSVRQATDPFDGMGRPRQGILASATEPCRKSSEGPGRP